MAAARDSHRRGELITNQSARSSGPTCRLHAAGAGAGATAGTRHQIGQFAGVWVGASDGLFVLRAILSHSLSFVYIAWADRGGSNATRRQKPHVHIVSFV